LSRAVPNAVILPSLNLMDDSAEKGARLKPKRKQEVGKRGPMKAVVPVDNMTRTNGAEKKGSEFLHWVLFSLSRHVYITSHKIL